MPDVDSSPALSAPRTPASHEAVPPSQSSSPHPQGGRNVVEPSDPFSMPITPAPERTSEIGNISSPLNYGTPSSMESQYSVSRGTPFRSRRDLGTQQNVRQFNTNAENENVDMSEGNPEEHIVIWGTDVVLSTCKNKFKNFILTFKARGINDADDNEQNEERTIYVEALEKISILEEPFIDINCEHINQFSSQLYRQIIYYPQEVIPAFDMVINELFFTKYPAQDLPHQIQVRPFNCDKTKNMRSLNPEDIDRLITISGMVIRTSNIIPEMREAFFSCTVCNHTETVEVIRGRIAEPTLCSHCSTTHSFNLIHNRSLFSDKQLIKFQESPDDMPAGQTPHTVSLFAHNALVDNVQPGHRVTVTGLYRALPIQVNPRMRNIKAVHKTHIDVLHYQKVSSGRLFDDEKGSHKFSDDRIELLKELSQRSDIYERLAHAIAPSIYGNEDIKKGILLQLFGGTKKNAVRGKSGFRSEINVLLCGDPGTSKSQLLTYVYNLVPRSQYTSGKGSSAVGLTAYVSRDPETRQVTLQTGALVLADNGICCIDEFDKMNDATRSILHEVMEQQTLSIAKAGIICQLNARTSILAAANPVESQWNKNKTIIENIKLSHTLLSRFDLIFLILDPQSEHYDKKLASHLVSLYYNEQETEENEAMEISVLRDYLKYAKDNVQPVLSEEAQAKLIQAYVDMRKVGSGRGQVSAYPRQLESLIRLSEAHAKIRLASTVTVEDVEEAMRLHREALKQSATDPLSGKIDINILTTGLSMAARKKRAELTEFISKIIKAKERGSNISYSKLFQEVKETSQLMVTRDMFEESLKPLQDEGLITITNKNTIKIND